MPDDIIGPLVTKANAAWDEVATARIAADAADAEVKKALQGKQVLITGYATGRIGGGSVKPIHQRFVDEPVTVTSVFYYFDPQYDKRVNTLRVRDRQGGEWEFPVSGTKSVSILEKAVS